MSSLTKEEKQALNDLFMVLKEKENLLQKIKNSKKTLLLIFRFIFKPKNSKNPSA